MRIFNTYGPRMHPNDGRVVSNFIVRALKGEDITVYGDASQTGSFWYVDDLVDGLVRLMATPPEVMGPVNLGRPEEVMILALAEMILRQTKSKAKVVFKSLPADDPVRRRPDITQAKEKLGWSPKLPLEEGLRKTVNYFQDLV